MVVKLFLLGRPGSGKSTAARYIELLVKDREWSVISLNDYKFLQDLFHADIDHKLFRPVGPPGCDAFDVINFDVLDLALTKIKQAAEDYLYHERKLILMEFARDEYSKPLKLFGHDFLHDAYFLFLEANVDICLQRIRDRALYPATQDDHFVSEDILRNYYRKNNKDYMASTFARDFDFEKERIAIIDNMGSWKEFGLQVKSFIEYVITREDYAQQKTSTGQIITSSKDTASLSTSPLHNTASTENPVQREEKSTEVGNTIAFVSI
jgi:energy-coupling factor transporter ATP-binding protein EcfA2